MDVLNVCRENMNQELTVGDGDREEGGQLQKDLVYNLDGILATVTSTVI